MSKSKIILVGGGGHCRSCIDVIEQEGRFDIYGIVDQAAAQMKEVLGYPVIGSDDDLSALRQECEHALITVGQIKSSAVRNNLNHYLKDLEFTLPVIMSPLSHVSRHANVGEGTIIMHGAIVNAGAKIGMNCILNSRCLIEHDAEIGSFVHVSTGAIINGGTWIGAHSFIGSGATVVQGLNLPKNSFVCAEQLVASEADVRVMEGE